MIFRYELESDKNDCGLESCIGSGFKTRHAYHHAQQLQRPSRIVCSVCVSVTHTKSTTCDDR
jgi:hypothetical protein